MNAEPNVERVFTKRGRLDIIHSILVTVRRDNPGALKTHILYKSNLSHSLLNRYLDFIVDNGMVKTRKIRKKLVYEITDKGREFLRAYEDLRIIIEGKS